MPQVRRDDRQQDVRGGGPPGKDAIAGDTRMPPLAFRLTGIWVDVEMWEIAASRYRVAGGVPGTARRQRLFVVC